MKIHVLLSLCCLSLLAGTHTSPKKHIDSPESVSGLCNELFRFTCAPGEYNDGTGVGFTANQIVSRIEDLKRSQSGVFSARFLEAVKKDPAFRQLSLSVLGLEHSPECTDSAQLARCNDTLSKGLAQVGLHRIFAAEPTGKAMKGSLHDLDRLLHDPTFIKIEDGLAKETREAIQDKKALENIKQNVFPHVSELILGVIQENIKDPAIVQKLTTKVKAIEFAGTDCTEGEGEDDRNVSGLVVPNAFYDPEENSFKYCNGFLLQNNSLFQIVNTIAHELGHAFDPCGIALAPKEVPDVAVPYTDPQAIEQCESEFAFTGLVPCMRKKESVQAARQDAEPAPSEKSDLKKSPFCTNNDQICEAFADWVAAEVTPRYMEKHHASLTKAQFQLGYANVFRGGCDNTQKTPPSTEWDEHPSDEARVNRLLLVQPQVRKQMGCPADTPPAGSEYCAVEKKGAP